MDLSRAPDTSPAASATPSSTLSTARGPGTGRNSADASASAAVSPPRPQSGAAATAPHADAPHPAGDGNADEAKRPRACEACRGLKVRCEMADEGPCRRCRKAGRRCVVTVRSRGGERQKKTDTRVAELEKKIDFLAATLHARGGSEHTGASGGSSTQQRPGSLPSVAGSPEESRAPVTMVNSLLTHWGVTEGAASPSQPATGQKRKLSDTQDARAGDEAAKHPRLGSSSLGEDYVDIVDRGLITAERAEALLGRYNKLMAPHFPAVVFPPDETAANIRASKPLLFLALMAASTSDSGALQKTLVKELMRILADKVIVGGEKSFELVQTLFVSVAWYWPPESFDELKFYQLAHIGIVLAIDIGLGRAGGGARPRSHQFPGFGNPSRGPNRVDAESVECRRTWLAGYLLSTNTAIGLRRVNLLTWSSFMRESVEILETSEDAAPSDKYLCQLVRANRLGEEIMTQFSLDDPVMSVNLSDVRTQLTLKGFEKQLEKMKRDVPSELQQPALLIGWGTIDVFMHETSLHSDDFDHMKGCFPTTRLDDGLANMTTPTTAQLDAVLASFSAVTGIFETFINMDLDSIRSLPVFNLVRVAYSIVVLIKIYFTATAPDSELGKILPKETIKVDYYLESMTAKFMAAAAEDKCRPAAKFLIVIVMLRGWLNNKTSEKERRLRADSSENQISTSASPETRAARGDSMPMASRASGNPGSLANARERASQERAGPRPSSLSSGAMQQPGLSSYPMTTTANTPLQLLSEVATGDPNVGGRPMGWQATPGGGGGGGGNPFFLPNGAAGMGPMDMTTTGSMAPQWTEAASGMGYFLGDTVDWEGMAMSWGAGMSSEQEYEIMNMVTELNKPWGGDGMGQVPSGQGVYY